MDGLKNKVISALNECLLAPGIGAPEHEDLGPFVPSEFNDGPVREFFPSFSCMGCGPVSLNRERAVQKQYSLPSPPGKIL